MKPAGITLRWAQVRSAVLCGLQRPTILLPAEASQWDGADRRAVLLHELSHLRRRDLWANALAAMATAAWWFHPLVWFLGHRGWMEQESACDNLVLMAGQPAPRYAELLMEMAAKAGPGMALECSMTGKGELKQRIANVLDDERPRNERRLMSAKLLAIATMAIATLVFLRPAQTRAEQVEKVGGDVKAPGSRSNQSTPMTRPIEVSRDALSWVSS